MPSDLVGVLADDHAVLQRLGNQLLGAPPGRARRATFLRLAPVLGAHLTVVDRTVLPALKGLGWRGVRSDLLSGHMALKRRLAEAVACSREGIPSDDDFAALAQQVKEQCALERDALLPLLLTRLDATQRAMLALDADQHRIRLLGEAPPVRQQDGVEPSALELVEEAYLVLGSLPVPRQARLPSVE